MKLLVFALCAVIRTGKFRPHLEFGSGLRDIFGKMTLNVTIHLGCHIDVVEVKY